MKKILYLCDRNQCDTCNPECNRTEDIDHAVNFKKIIMDDTEYYVEALRTEGGRE